MDNLYDNKSITINDKTFPVKIKNEIKFSHFNRFVTKLSFNDNQTIKDIATTVNFENYAGKYNREDWGKIEAFFDSHFKTDFDWKKQSNWNDNFIKSNRNYLTMSIGFQVKVVIPYEYLQQIDKKETDIDKVSEVFVQIYNYYKDLL